MEERYTLFQLNSRIKNLIEEGMPDSYWVEAEIAELRESGGHCYIELIEKDERSNTPIAKASARCWRSRWAIVKSHFFHVTGSSLARNMKVLLFVSPQFHENYGFSWIVNDIDPTFTLGEMAMKRKEIISILKKEGVFDANRDLPFPLFSQRIAVISSATAAGYGDFCNQLSDNEYGYAFTTTLFEAVMQGEEVERSVIEALNAIFEHMDDYDCVVITRGGGATSDFSGFDALDLSRNVANFPLPVITAIGHDRDETILDMISNVSVKTPTAAAAFLIDRLHGVGERIDTCRIKMAKIASEKMQQEMAKIHHLSIRIPSLFSVVKTSQMARLDLLDGRLTAGISQRTMRHLTILDRLNLRITSSLIHRLTKEKHRIEILSQKTEALDPQRILDRGYSITLYQGKAVMSCGILQTGDEIETRLKDGTVTSIIKG